jgi:hypothetical protein
MRIKAQLIILFAILSLVVSGQNKIQGYVLDNHTNKPLSYAIVSEVHQKYGSYSDTTGLFTMLFQNINDSLKVSNIGYSSITICIKDLQKNATILLEGSPLHLGEVIVKPSRKKLQEEEIGFFTKKTNISTAMVYPLNLKAVFVSSQKVDGIILIKAIKFTYVTTDGGSPLRIRVLKPNDNGEPGEDLVSENLIINKAKNGNKLVANIDISKASIYMPKDGVYIVFEWIMDKSLANTNVKVGIPGPYICAVKSNIETSQWINNLNSSKWTKVQARSTLSVGLTVVDYSK